MTYVTLDEDDNEVELRGLFTCGCMRVLFVFGLRIIHTYAQRSVRESAK